MVLVYWQAARRNESELENIRSMGHYFRHLKCLIYGAAIYMGCVLPGAQALAEPVITVSPAEPSTSEVHPLPGLPEADLMVSDPDAALVVTDKAAGTRPDQPRLSRTGPEIATPTRQTAEDRSVPANAPRSGASQAPTYGPDAHGDGLGQEVRDAVKDAIRPLYRDLSDSGVADAMRGLRSELGLKKDQELGQSETTQGSPNAGHGNPDAASWETPGNKYGNGEPQRTAAQVERDKILASVMLAKLIDDAKPWLIGLVAVYVLGYLIKLAIAFGKYQSARRLRHVHRRSRRRTPS